MITPDGGVCWFRSGFLNILFNTNNYYLFLPTFPPSLKKISVLRKAGSFLCPVPKLKIPTMNRLVILTIIPLLLYNAWLPANANDLTPALSKGEGDVLRRNNNGGFITCKELPLAGKQDTVPHATVIFYRAYFPKYFSNVKKAPIYINDSLVHELKANTFISYNITKEGKIRVAVDKNQDTEIEFKLKFGKEYFFRVDVTGGLVNRNTSIESVTNAIGKEEIGMLPKKAFQEQ